MVDRIAGILNLVANGKGHETQMQAQGRGGVQ